MGGIVSLVNQCGPPDEHKRTLRGRRPVHSPEKLVVLALLTVALGCTFREMQRLVPKLGLPWEEPFPDHSTIHRAYQALSKEYLDTMLERSARLCAREVGWKDGLLAADSSGVEADRYEEVVRPSRRQKGWVTTRRILYLKYHIVAILDLLVILRAVVTSYRVQDSPTLRRMLSGFPRMPDSVFNADRGYDAEANFERLYSLGMRPNIRQRSKMEQWGGKAPHKKLWSRTRAAGEFDPVLYRHRGLVEGIFGAEETGGHRLRTRFRTEGSRERWGPAMAIGWNLRVLNRIRCGKRLRMEVLP